MINARNCSHICGDVQVVTVPSGALRLLLLFFTRCPNRNGIRQSYQQDRSERCHLTSLAGHELNISGQSRD